MIKLTELFSSTDTFASPYINKRIEIVASHNPRLNAMSVHSQDSIRKTLEEHGAEVRITLVDTIADLENLASRRPHLVVLGMKLILLEPSLGYENSPKVWLSDYLNANAIAFTGSDAQALNFEYDKQIAKQMVINVGLQSAAFFTAELYKPIPTHNLQFPLFIKPTNRGDSMGIHEGSVVHSQTELVARVRTIRKLCQSDVLVEEYLPGREFSVAVIEQSEKGELMALPIEITSPEDINGNQFLSHAIKEADSEVVSSVQNTALKNALNTLAIGVFEALGARDYGRIDLRLDAEGKPSFIEANLMPGLADHGYMARCFSLNKRISYADMILMIVNLGLARKKHVAFNNLNDALIPAYNAAIPSRF